MYASQLADSLRPGDWAELYPTTLRTRFFQVTSVRNTLTGTHVGWNATDGTSGTATFAPNAVVIVRKSSKRARRNAR